MSDWKEELEEAKELLASGIISESDFEELKLEILKKRNSLISYGVIDEGAAEAEIVEMILLPAGEFIMGSFPGDVKTSSREKPRHKVEITRDFYVGKYPVTQKLWKAVMGSNPSVWSERFGIEGEDRPVDSVTWFDCIEFCNTLSKMKGKEPVYTIKGEEVSCAWSANGYRLLSEAEWEYAAKANCSTVYAGSSSVDDVAWCKYNLRSRKERISQPVGQKKPNAFGLYDMSGNVCEWVWDWYGSYEDNGTERDPYGPSTGYGRVYRGGSHNTFEAYIRVSYRNERRPTASPSDFGFRLGCSL